MIKEGANNEHKEQRVLKRFTYMEVLKNPKKRNNVDQKIFIAKKFSVITFNNKN